MTTNRSAKKRGGRKLPETIAREDQLLAMLKGAEGFPVSTNELCKGLGTQTIRRGHCGTCSCEDVATWVVPIPNWEVNPLLNRLYKRGIIGKVRVPGFACNYWYWIAEEDR